MSQDNLHVTPIFKVHLGYLESHSGFVAPHNFLTYGFKITNHGTHGS